MENSEFLERIQQYAVRIGKAGDNELYGSGTLFLVSKRKKVCVLMAAHVVYSLIEKIEKKELEICLTCKDNKNNIHWITVNDSKNIYIHSKYKESNNKKEFFEDLALIDIPYFFICMRNNMKNIDIPVGISDFAEIRKNNFYYIDKTGLIEELLKTTATKVTLITRPRRFGKTLGMSMLENFFDIRKDSKLLFEGLVIADKQALCEKWMNQYPVMFLSLKSVDGNDFLTAYSQLAYEIGALYKEHDYLLESPVLGEEEKKLFWQIKERQAGKIEIMRSLQILSQLLNKIDEMRMKAVVPFQLAYAVSIHKAQGLEYDSVKIVIPDSNSERVTHGVFYTAITRAKKKLKIYWSAETMQSIVDEFSNDEMGNRSLEIIKKKMS